VSAIAMRMSALQQMVHSNPDRVIKELGKMEDLARKTTSEIRGMMFTLRPLALESQGLNAALEQLAEKMDAIYDQGVEVIVSPDAESVLTQHQSGTIFYIIEEAVNNARKHAEADVIYVRVSRYEDVVLVEIKDDGLGFDVAAVSENYEGRTSLGMVNLHERTDLVDGTLTIDSSPGKGTTVSVVVPVDPTGTRSQPPKRKAKSEPPKRVFRLSAMR
ncbi:MAG: sensor histidine kinase, partial [Chloroflexota bacterium]